MRSREWGGLLAHPESSIAATQAVSDMNFIACFTQLPQLVVMVNSEVSDPEEVPLSTAVPCWMHRRNERINVIVAEI